LQREIQRLVSSRVREGRDVCLVCASVTRELWVSVKLGLLSGLCNNRCRCVRSL